MNSIAIIALIATVSAESGYTCVQPDPEWTASTDASLTTDITDAAACGAACTALATDVLFDYCCFATTTLESSEGADDATTACALWSLETVADANIKTAKVATATESFDAWTWNAAVLAADMTAASDDSADSASMISSAIATIAAIAMVAY